MHFVAPPLAETPANLPVNHSENFHRKDSAQNPGFVPHSDSQNPEEIAVTKDHD